LPARVVPVRQLPVLCSVLRLGAGYGGGDARVPGGAETAAERAADRGGAEQRKHVCGCFCDAHLAPGGEPCGLRGDPASSRDEAGALLLWRAVPCGRGWLAPAPAGAHGVPSEPKKLLRVLPLPGENWGALVEEWCCHLDPFANKPLHPLENDCFIGDSFFLVNLRSDLKQEPKANTKVICKRCKVMLGETMSSETTKFYMTEIIIQASDRSFPFIPRSQFVQSVTAQCLVELSSTRSTFRFTIQGQDGKVYILLWLLNSDSLVIESLRSSECIRKFPLLEDTLKVDSSSALNAVKVLYQPCIKSRNEKLVSSWESDLSVHSLTLPSATCLELLLILSRSNAALPLSLRQMNSFQVAFLKM
uniref:E3 ubiquitin-protein ligase E3D n=1 Tax=Castor canadensis TaxID=51338 RepID=A0A8C0XHS0_CASCN